MEACGRDASEATTKVEVGWVKEWNARGVVASSAEMAVTPD